MNGFKMRTKADWPGGPALILLAALSLAALGTSGCRSFSTFSVDSRPAVPEVVINGSSDDWAGRTYSIGGGEVSLGFMNDGGYLYITLLTGDRAIGRQIMTGGLTVWFDPNGGQKKVSGIRFPIPGIRPEEPGMQLAEPPVEEEEEGTEPEPGPGTGPAEIEIIASEKASPRRMALDDAGGIEAAIGPAGAFFVYELKIPLARSEKSPFAVDAAPGAIVGIGFETGRPSRRAGPRAGGEGRPEGAGTPPGGGQMTGGIRPRQGGLGPGAGPDWQPDLPKDLKLWAFVRLSGGLTD